MSVSAGRYRVSIADREITKETALHFKVINPDTLEEKYAKKDLLDKLTHTKIKDSSGFFGRKAWSTSVDNTRRLIENFKDEAKDNFESRKKRCVQALDRLSKPYEK